MRNMKYLLCLVLFTLPALAEQQPVIESLYGVKLLDNKVAIKVKSNGCSTNDKFNLMWSAQQLIIVREKPDNCRRMPHLVWLTFELKDATFPFVLQNPIVGYEL